MVWYRNGTVTVTNGGTGVTGAGTDFIQNAQAGHGFRGPDGRLYEIAAIVSATQLTLGEVYAGPTAGGQPYAIQPTSSLARDLALGVAQLLQTFGDVRDTIGQGYIADGTTASPGIRFLADQDTGFYREGPNVIGLTVGGSRRLRLSESECHLPGSVVTGLGAGATDVAIELGQARAAEGAAYIDFHSQPGTDYEARILRGAGPNGDLVLDTMGVGSFRLILGGAERLSVSAGGHLLSGATSGAHSRFTKPDAGGDSQKVLGIGVTTGDGHHFYTTSGGAGSASATAYHVHANGNTGRSINAGGTINASGADYAEYMTKAPNCGTIAKGDVCGVDAQGLLTRTWAEAHSFVIKSTDPSYVGGDDWGRTVGKPPEGPGEAPTAPPKPAAAPRSDSAEDRASWQASVESYPAQVAAYDADHAAWASARASYDANFPIWAAALEAEREKVDRIAFAGQVPVNVTGDFEVGDYLIAAASGAGIKAVAVHEADITFDQYRRRLGKVWAVRDGRAWVDVQHG